MKLNNPMMWSVLAGFAIGAASLQVLRTKTPTVCCASTSQKGWTCRMFIRTSSMPSLAG